LLLQPKKFKNNNSTKKLTDNSKKEILIVNQKKHIFNVLIKKSITLKLVVNKKLFANLLFKSYPIYWINNFFFLKDFIYQELLIK